MTRPRKDPYIHNKDTKRKKHDQTKKRPLHTSQRHKTKQNMTRPRKDPYIHHKDTKQNKTWPDQEKTPTYITKTQNEKNMTRPRKDPYIHHKDTKQKQTWPDQKKTPTYIIKTQNKTWPDRPDESSGSRQMSNPFLAAASAQRRLENPSGSRRLPTAYDRQSSCRPSEWNSQRTAIGPWPKYNSRQILSTNTTLVYTWHNER